MKYFAAAEELRNDRNRWKPGEKRILVDRTEIELEGENNKRGRVRGRENEKGKMEEGEVKGKRERERKRREGRHMAVCNKRERHPTRGREAHARRGICLAYVEKLVHSPGIRYGGIPASGM